MRSAGGFEGGDDEEIDLQIEKEEKRERASLSLKNDGEYFELEVAVMVKVRSGVVLEFR